MGAFSVPSRGARIGGPVTGNHPPVTHGAWQEAHQKDARPAVLVLRIVGATPAAGPARSFVHVQVHAGAAGAGRRAAAARVEPQVPGASPQGPIEQCVVHLPDRRRGVDPHLEQHLVAVDVADPRNHRLIE